jgi:hypothetical protein
MSVLTRSSLIYKKRRQKSNDTVPLNMYVWLKRQLLHVSCSLALPDKRTHLDRLSFNPSQKGWGRLSPQKL